MLRDDVIIILTKHNSFGSFPHNIAWIVVVRFVLSLLCIDEERADHLWPSASGDHVVKSISYPTIQLDLD